MITMDELQRIINKVKKRHNVYALNKNFVTRKGAGAAPVIKVGGKRERKIRIGSANTSLASAEPASAPIGKVIIGGGSGGSF